MPRYTREEEKRRQRFKDAKARVAAEEEAQTVEQGTPGDPSMLFTSIEAMSDDQFRFLRHVRVLLLARVSTQKQADNGDLEDQVANLRKAAKRWGLNVVGVVRHVGKANDPTWLKKVARAARQHKVICVFAEDITRYIRHPQAHKKRSNYWWLPREEDYLRAASMTKGLKLLTLAPLNMTQEQIRSLQTKRGQEAKDSKGGRPKNKQAGYKRKMREGYADTTRELRNCGYSFRHIASHVSRLAGFPISHMTVARWFRQCDNAQTLFPCGEPTLKSGFADTLVAPSNA